MCLYLDELPDEFDKSEYLIVQKVYKALNRQSGWYYSKASKGIYYTPYQYTRLPDNGILTAIGTLRVTPPYSEGRPEQVHQGAIHSYVNKEKGYGGYSRNRFMALAIDVIAWGEYHDLVSSVIYVQVPKYKRNKGLDTILRGLTSGKPAYIPTAELFKHLPKEAIARIKADNTLKFAK